MKKPKKLEHEIDIFVDGSCSTTNRDRPHGGGSCWIVCSRSNLVPSIAMTASLPVKVSAHVSEVVATLGGFWWLQESLNRVFPESISERSLGIRLYTDHSAISDFLSGGGAKEVNRSSFERGSGASGAARACLATIIKGIEERVENQTGHYPCPKISIMPIVIERNSLAQATEADVLSRAARLYAQRSRSLYTEPGPQFFVSPRNDFWDFTKKSTVDEMFYTEDKPGVEISPKGSIANMVSLVVEAAKREE